MWPVAAPTVQITMSGSTPGQDIDSFKNALVDQKVIGNGSFGVVYQATLKETGETVAVKRVLQDKRFKVGAFDRRRSSAIVNEEAAALSTFHSIPRSA